MELMNLKIDFFFHFDILNIKKVQCRLSNLRNGHVTLSNLRLGAFH